MNFLRMMGGGGESSAAAPAPPPAPPPTAPLAEVKLTEMSITVAGLTITICCCDNCPPGSEINPVFILDRDEQTLKDIIMAQRAEYEAVRNLDGRNWYPQLAFVGLSSKQAALTPEQWVTILPQVVGGFGGYPYARSLCGLTTDGGRQAVQAVLNDADASKLFSYFVVGDPTGILPDGPKFGDKTAICLCAGTADVAAATTLKQALEGVRCGKSTYTEMFVQNHTGEQTYREVQTGYGVELLEYGDDERERNRRVGLWLGSKLERRKLERLGSLMPWHEFK